MKDYLVKSLAFNGQIRAYAIGTTNMVKEAQERHDLWVNASAALGRTMTAATMIGAMQKGDAKLTIKIEGDGPLGPILVDANAKGETRGYVTNPHVQLERNAFGKIDVKGAVGTQGMLTVVKDLGLRDYFTGQVELVSGEIAEDFTYYFAISEQTPSSVALGVLVNPDHSILAAGGFIIQLLPSTTEEVIQQIEDKLKAIPPVSSMVREGLTPEEILNLVLGEENVEIIEKMDVRYHCPCSRDRMEGALISLGRNELENIIEEDGQAELHCHFCNEKYLFTEEELKELIIQSK